MHAYTTDGETYIHVERQTDTNQETVRDTHRKKLYIFPRIHIHFANNV